VIAATANEPVRGEYLSRIAAGEIAAYAGTERGTGSNFWALESAAVAVAGGFRLKLRKSWATLAEVADLFIIPTRAHPDAEMTEISLFLVERREGVQAAEPWKGTGMRGSSSGPVDVDALVPRERLMGTPGRANDYITTDMFNLLLLAHAALYLGVAEEALKLAAARMVRRVFAHTGQALADHSLWQARIGALAAETRAAGALVQRTAVDVDAAYGGRTLSEDALAGKLCACGLARRATDAAMEIFGGSGYNRGERVELLWRDARAGSLMRPSDELTQMILGRLACGMAPFGSGG
jgi:alkylation response protein AidB-like acyl-CoA dehydrogenase